MRFSWKLAVWAALACLVLLASCARDTKRQRAIAVWRSPQSTPDELLEAIEVLVPIGAAPTEVERLLGAQAKWIHWHGPTMVVYHQTNQTVVVEPIADHDYWTLEYPVVGGSIALYFEGTCGKPPNEWRFVRAGYRKNLEPTFAPSKEEAK